MTEEKFVGIVWTIFEKIEKSRKLAFLAIFGLILAIFLTFQPYDFDAIAQVGTPLGENDCAKFHGNRMDSF